MQNHRHPSKENRHLEILEAAKNVFARYGFKRTSMADIAQEAGLSRPALYLEFQDKLDLFRSLAHHIRDTALERARKAWLSDAPFSQGLQSALLARELPLFQLLCASAHGQEIISKKAGLNADIADEMEEQFIALIEQRAIAAAARGQIRLPVDGARAVARTIACAANGLKLAAQTEDELRRDFGVYTTLLAAGLRS